MITGIPASPGIVFGKALVLKEEKIVIIAGFQGVTRDNNITTLGRRRL